MFPVGRNVHGDPASGVPGAVLMTSSADGGLPLRVARLGWWQIRSVRRQAGEKVSVGGERLAGSN